MEYIDVRGAYPIYFRGSLFLRLPVEAGVWDIYDARDYMIQNGIKL